MRSVRLNFAVLFSSAVLSLFAAAVSLAACVLQQQQHQPVLLLSGLGLVCLCSCGLQQFDAGEWECAAVAVEASSLQWLTN